MSGEQIIERERGQQVLRDVVARAVFGRPVPADEVGQVGAAARELVTDAVARTLGKLLAETTLEPGPWLLHADGTITRPKDT